MKILKKTLLFVLAFLVIGVTLMIIFSPYKTHGTNQYSSVDVTVVIDVPTDSVYNYLGNSDNAIDWSSFVDHISVLNPEVTRDGTVGSIRRCFKNKNEKGIIWDEEVLEDIPNLKRRLSIYNLQGFPLQAEGLQTEQIYKSLGENKMELTFSVFFRDHEPSLMELLKMNYAAYVIRNIFEANLENIKELTENQMHS